ncbi:MAG: hypothetical protein HYS44_02930 [Candidatus Niyogibacteria bacterium]|nr:hypothetical protein [Candidatus Niyogibacteria bacterium]
MNNRFMKDVFAIAVGAFLGALLAHAMGGFWLIGILVGGAAGYITRGLTEPRRVNNSVQRAFRAAFYRYPVALLDGGWRRTKEGIALGAILGSVIGMVFAIFSWIVFFIDPNPLKLSTQLTIHAVFAFGAPIFISIIAALLCFSVISTGNALIRDPSPPSKHVFYWNSITWHVFVVWFTVIGCWLFLKWLPSAPRHLALATRFTGHFLMMFARFVHREDFSACGIYALIAALGIFLYAPNHPIPIALAAFAGGIIGAVMRRIVLRLAFATS